MSPELDADERRQVRAKAHGAALDALRALGGEATREAILRRALAAGAFTARERGAAPPRGARERGLVEHHVAGALGDLRREGLVACPRWGVWQLAGAALHAAEPTRTPVPAPSAAPLSLRTQPPRPRPALLRRVLPR